MTKKKVKVSLVLGSGGARGLAHIGVINWLKENDYDIRSISGSSMGALIGGVYACGELDTYTRWVLALKKVDIIRLVDFSFSNKGLFKGDRIINTLKELIGEHRIEDLPLSYTAVATDIDKGKEIWLNSGPLFDAIRASIAIPTLITPHFYLGKHLLDGSLINPVPIAPTLNDKTDITIAINLSGKVEPIVEPSGDELPLKSTNNGYHKSISNFINSLHKTSEKRSHEDMHLLDVIVKSMETMQNTIARFQLAAYSPDIIIEIPKNACAFYEFHRAAELVDVGWVKTDEQMKNRNKLP